MSAVPSNSKTDMPILDSVQKLIASNNNMFQEPTALPPTRSLDHKISLLLGVQPVNVKPYRYSPTQKDEIERQVQEMLLNGVIQPTSPFSSPVLLVKKKDGT